MNGARLLLYGGACVAGGVGLAILVGAMGAELLLRYIEERR